MKLQDELKFRELQVVFFLGMSEYPNDRERMEAGMKLLIEWIDKLVEKECSLLVGANATLTQGGKIKGFGGGSGGRGTIH
jgi:hypothetical protein